MRTDVWQAERRAEIRGIAITQRPQLRCVEDTNLGNNELSTR